MPRSRRTSPTSCRRRAAGGDPQQRLACPRTSALVRSLALEMDEAAQARLEGVGLPVELVAVERHASLEAQCVPGAEAAGHETRGGTCREQGVPEARPLVPGDEELEAVLARVAGARDQGRARRRPRRSREAYGRRLARSRLVSGPGCRPRRDPGWPAARCAASRRRAGRASASWAVAAASRSVSSAATTSRFEALGTTSSSAGAVR